MCTAEILLEKISCYKIALVARRGLYFTVCERKNSKNLTGAGLRTGIRVVIRFLWPYTLLSRHQHDKIDTAHHLFRVPSSGNWFSPRNQNTFKRSITNNKYRSFPFVTFFNFARNLNALKLLLGVTLATTLSYNMAS